MRTKILILGLICLFVFTYCDSPADPEIEKALNPGIEKRTETQIKFQLRMSNCGLPKELRDVFWYEIFEVYINDGIGTYGDGLLLHTHEYGRDGIRYYEVPEDNACQNSCYEFIPPIVFPGTKERLNSAFERTTEFDFEVWFQLKESNIPLDLIRKFNPRILIDLVPMEKDLQYTDTRFECWPYNLDSNCLSWTVGERTISSPDAGYNRLHFRVMIL